MGKKGDKKRAKRRTKQLVQGQLDRASNPPRIQSPQPKPTTEVQTRSKAPAHKTSKRRPVDPESPEGPLTPRKISEAEYVTIEWPAPDDAPENAPSIQFSLQIKNKTINPGRHVVSFETIPIEETIHPRVLNFAPPLQEYGREGAKGFSHYWEKLDYVFSLPDPYTFPSIPMSAEDRAGIERYIAMCRRLASFSIINDDTTLSVGRDPATGDWHVRVTGFPADESFLGASAAFRQLHNDGESASFSNAHNTLFRVMKTLPEDQQAAVRETVPLWREARGKLMRHTLHTLTALKASNATLENPVSYGNINPDELIRTFNYGDSLHFGDARNQLNDLLADPYHEAYYKYSALLSIDGLCHLYFGFAVLLSNALSK